MKKKSFICDIFRDICSSMVYLNNKKVKQTTLNWVWVLEALLFLKKNYIQSIIWNYILLSHCLNCQLPLKVAFWFGLFFVLSYASKESIKLLNRVTSGKDTEHYFKMIFIFHWDS